MGEKKYCSWSELLNHVLRLQLNWGKIRKDWLMRIKYLSHMYNAYVDVIQLGMRSKF